MHTLILRLWLIFGLATASAQTFNDDSNWFPFGGFDGFDGVVRTIVFGDPEDVYFGGNFTSVDGIEANRVVKWDGFDFTPLGDGLNGIVRALAWDNGILYAGGEFTKSGTTNVFNIASWDGTEWTPLGSGAGGTVHALTVSGSDLYAGGDFAGAGGIAASSLAVWDGTEWQAVGDGTNGTVYALAADSDGDVYVGGDFTTSGETTLNHVAMVSGDGLQALGDGVGSRVGAIAVSSSGSGTDIYVGGEFLTAGGVAANRVALWDGEAWEPVGGGVNSSVLALATSGPNLYAAGFFSFASGVQANRIAKWNGISWTPLGSGMNNWGAALAIREDEFAPGGEMFVGGGFTTVGGFDSPYAAVAELLGDPEFTLEDSEDGLLSNEDTLDFGAVLSDSEGSTRFLIIDNPGASDLEITSIAITGIQRNQFELSELDLNPIPGGLLGSFDILFSPTSEGLKTATLEITSNDPLTPQFTIDLTGEEGSATRLYEIAVEDAGLTGTDAEPDAIPFNDGVENLLKYAFNMDLSGPDASTLTADGDSGLPRYSVIEKDGDYFFRFEFIRSKGNGLIYTPQKSPDLESSFQKITGTETVEDLSQYWERVIIDEPVDLTTTPTCFGRVMVEFPEN